MLNTYLHKQCSICGFWGINNIFKKEEINFFSCNNCGIIFIDPLPSKEDCVEKYQNYHKEFVSDEKYLKNMQDGAKRLKTRLYYEGGQSLVRPNKQNKTLKLLDVGCGLGYFLKEMSTDFDVCGVEVSSFQVDFARRKLGLNVFHGTLLEANFPDEYFDVVTMWEVIEHLPDPLEYIREINRILKSEGLLAFSTPNFKGLTSIITKNRWHLCDPKEHLYYFSPKSIKNILQGSGFRIINIFSDNINIPNIVKYLRKREIDSAQIWKERKAYLYKIESNQVLKYAKNIINYFLNLTKRGDNLRVYAKKFSFTDKVKNAKKILLLDNHGIGDVVVSIPLLKSVRDNFPNANIGILLRSELEKDVLEPLNLCDSYYYFQRIKKTFTDKKSNLIFILKLLLKLKKERFEIVLNTQGINMLLAGLLCILIGAKYRVSEVVGWKGLLFNIKVFPMKIHRVYRNNNIGRAIGLNSFIAHPYLLVDRNAEIFVDNIFEKNNLYKKSIIGIHIGNPKDQHERYWPIDKCEELIRKINQLFPNVVCVLFGSKAEKNIVKKLNIKNTNNILDLTSVLGIKETISCIKRCKLFISGDSGLMHVAAALNIPTITLFGPTSSDVIAPFWNNGIIIKSKVRCSPCYDNEEYRRGCKTPICMSAIDIEAVLNFVNHFFADRF